MCNAEPQLEIPGCQCASSICKTVRPEATWMILFNTITYKTYPGLHGHQPLREIMPQMIP